jgi:hypothetical protein
VALGQGVGTRCVWRSSRWAVGPALGALGVTVTTEAPVIRRRKGGPAASFVFLGPSLQRSRRFPTSVRSHKWNTSHNRPVERLGIGAVKFLTAHVDARVVFQIPLTFSRRGASQIRVKKNVVASLHSSARYDCATYVVGPMELDRVLGAASARPRKCFAAIATRLAVEYLDTQLSSFVKERHELCLPERTFFLLTMAFEHPERAIWLPKTSAVTVITSPPYLQNRPKREHSSTL